jgi:hypothetical protein
VPRSAFFSGQPPDTPFTALPDGAIRRTLGTEEDSFEREARRLYRLAGCAFEEGAPPAALARGLLGRDAIREVPEQVLPAGGAIARIGGAWRVFVRRGMAPTLARFTVVHELAHWALGVGASELECDALAARLLAPRPAFERALRESGVSYTKLARWFGCTETFAALRYGEVTDEPLVVVAPATVRVRGRSFSWPSEPELRSLVKAPALPGLRKARLGDAPARVAIRRA